jgi:hypothetical protein
VSHFSTSTATPYPDQRRFSFMFDKIMPLSSAVEAYDLFNSMKAQKIIFKP